MIAAPSPQPESPTEDLLQRFLSGHDAPCPTCGYNLRGAGGDQCPECGRALTLELAIREPGHLWGRRGLLLLVFAWLLIAGGINATRAGRVIYNTANAMSQVWFTTTAPGNRTPIFIQSSPNTSLTITTNPPANAPVVTTPTPLSRFNRLSTTGSTITGQFNLAFPGTTQMTTWGNVTWVQWARAGAWTSLALLAAAGLIVLFRYRRKPASARVARTLMTLAWVGFAGYLGYHVVVFAQEWV